jgi:predicted Zn-dependent protease
MALRASLLFLVALTLVAQERQLGQGVNFYSLPKEAALGASLAQDLKKDTSAVESPALRDYVRRIGSQLAQQLTNAPFSYTFSVIADDRGGRTHEPLSLPGGYIFVPTSLILASNDGAEFAGMLAHAMAHVAERHGTRLATRGELANLTTIPIFYMASSEVMADAARSQIPAGFRIVQRRFETEADALALKMTSDAGYDPKALVRYIARTQIEASRESRVAAMENAIRKLPLRTYSAGSADDFAQLQDEVRRTVIR